MITAVDPDPVAFTRDLLDELKPGSAIAAVTVVADRLDNHQPPVILVQDRLHARARGVGMYNPARVALRVFGQTAEEASAIYRAAALLLHGRGPLSRPRGRVWKVFEEVGAQPTEDPDTHWPVTFGVFDLYMADR